MQMQAKKIMADIAILVLSQVAVYYGFKYLISSVDPSEREKEESLNKSKTLVKRLNLESIKLNQYEKIIMSEVIIPQDINVSFSDIGGLDDIIQDLKESVIYPLLYPQLFTSALGLLGSPKGVLLYGPPGCGKTMLAKALAGESGARFINLHLSTMMDKWYGESNKLVRAVFTLAEKLQPTIIFIDEIDSFMRSRKSNDHEASSMMLAEFMSLWDGLNTKDNNRIIVIGATNLPNNIDLAILRRMPKRFYLKSPNFQQRLKIIKLILRDVKLENNFDFNQLARMTENFSGSDIKELCRNTAMIPIHEYMRNNPLDQVKDLELSPSDSCPAASFQTRPLSISDFSIDSHKIGQSLMHSYNTMSDDQFLPIEECD
jgi:SpoVK/Ycf46/Vps4 family AAA+-type ATPase